MPIAPFGIVLPSGVVVGALPDVLVPLPLVVTTLVRVVLALGRVTLA